MLLVDTNALVDVLQDDPRWANWSVDQLRALAIIHHLAVNPIIYAEISSSFSTLEGLDRAVYTLALELREMPQPALFLAAKAHAQHRKRGGSKLPLRNLLPDAGSRGPLRLGRCQSLKVTT